MGASPLILIVEDNPSERFVLKQLLEKFDFDSHIVSSGEGALKAIANNKYSCILMDITLPEMDGFECTRRIRQTENGTHVPIVALTCRDDQASKHTADDVGMDDFLSKPFEAEQLRKILLRYVYDSGHPNLKVLNPRTL